MKTALRIIGALFLLGGLVWIGQGTGVFPYPPQSFMFDAMPWAYRGAGLMVLGVALLIIAARRKNGPRN
jgi:hypothetical protein